MLLAIILLAVVVLVGCALIAIRRHVSAGANIRFVDTPRRKPPLFAQYRRW